ncbi:MAG: ATP phosphoribosyltransferase regulatory subunit [Oscillospiraceae bacterium]
MKRFDLITPEGTKDLLFEDCVVRNEVEKRISDVFKSKGYCEIKTPGIEFFDVFNLRSRYFPQESMYKLVDSKGRLLVVRPDSTMPIARVVATRLREAKLPLRMFYNQNVYRSKSAMRGRSDEIKQMGIELIGSDSKRADLEVITTAVEVLSSCDNDKFRLEIGNIGLFRKLVEKLPVDEETREEIRSFIEVKNYPALNDILDSIGNNEVTNALKQLPRLFGGVEVFDKAANLLKDKEIDMILAELKALYTDLLTLGYDGKITVDLGIVNKMHYYTGVVIKGYLEGYGDAVLSGGRYNHLLSEFGYDVPATGFAINVDAVSGVLMRKNEYKVPAADVIVFAEDGYEIDGLKQVSKLGSEGRIALNSVFDTLEETEKYAREFGIKKIICVSDKITEKTLEDSENV